MNGDWCFVLPFASMRERERDNEYVYGVTIDLQSKKRRKIKGVRDRKRE